PGRIGGRPPPTRRRRPGADRPRPGSGRRTATRSTPRGRGATRRARSIANARRAAEPESFVQRTRRTSFLSGGLSSEGVGLHAITASAPPQPPCPGEKSRLEGGHGRKARSPTDLPPSAWRYRVESRGKVPRPG